ncbi:alpha/beta fold hydrolase [Kitasatospora sp. NPDC004240]
MPSFSAPDGTRLSYRVEGAGDGDPVVCLPGGPTDSRYLGDLGGLSAHRRLVVLDPRGTGASAVPEDADTYRCDRMAEDVEALREHLGLARPDLLAHCAGANLAVRYAERYPHRIGRLVLITPSPRAVGITVTGEERIRLAALRREEPWFPAAFAALEALVAGTGGDPEAIAPFLHGRWDDEARRLNELARPGDLALLARFGADGAFDPEATRAALATLDAPALLLAGAHDLNSPPASVAEYAGLFPRAEYVLRPGAGHFPWADDPAAFVAAVAPFLR